MIRITIEILPFGDEHHRQIIATGDIINDSSGDVKYGNYTYTLYSQGKLWRGGKIKRFSRLKNNIWELLKKALNNSPNWELHDVKNIKEIAKGNGE